MAGRLAGKTAFCTASGAGIGRATAIAFAREGASVIASDISLDALKGLRDEGVAETHLLDVRNTKSVEDTAKRIGAVDILFNAAGFVHHGTRARMHRRRIGTFSFDSTSNRCTARSRRSCRPCWPRAAARSSTSPRAPAPCAAFPNRYAYGATKAAVIGLTKAVAADFIRKGVRCNAICPGTVQSPSLDSRIAAQAKTLGKTDDEVRQMFIDRQPMGRLGTAEEIAAIAVYLASDESAFTTGQTFLVDGGFAL